MGVPVSAVRFCPIFAVVAWVLFDVEVKLRSGGDVAEVDVGEEGDVEGLGVSFWLQMVTGSVEGFRELF